MESLKKYAELEIAISDISFGGQGVARIDDFVVFIKGAIPGDRARIEVIKKKKNFAEARVVEIIKPSPDRTEAPCPHFGVCGGCVWQDVNYSAQLEFKRRNVQDVFERIGGIENPAVLKTAASPRMFHYRNKMEFTFGNRPWMTTGQISDPCFKTGSFALGLHVPQRYDKVLPVTFCYLQSAEANQALNCVSAFAEQSGLPPYAVKTHEGFWRFLVIRQAVHTQELMVNVITASENDQIMQSLKSKLLTEIPQITSLIHSVSRKKAQIAFGDIEYNLYGPPVLREKIFNTRYEIAPNAFFQTNTLAAEKLYETALNLSEVSAQDIVWDLYSGTGAIAIYFSQFCREVIGIEIVPEAVENAKQNAIRNQVSNCRFIQGEMRTAIRELNTAPSLIIVDPPRSGLHEDVIESILSVAPPKIIYISCNPATQARDIGLMRTHYAVDKIQPVDMFPHTAHVENIVRLIRK